MLESAARWLREPPVNHFSLSTLLLTGCYGTLGLESGAVADTQLNASSVWEWNNSVWAPSGARLKKRQLPWSAAHNNRSQWLQIDLKREKRITGTQQQLTGRGGCLRGFSEPYPQV